MIKLRVRARMGGEANSSVWGTQDSLMPFSKSFHYGPMQTWDSRQSENRLETKGEKPIRAVHNLSYMGFQKKSKTKGITYFRRQGPLMSWDSLKRIRSSSLGWWHTIFKSCPELSSFLGEERNYRMDVIIIKLSHLETGCCFPQLHAITWWKMKMSLDLHYFFQAMKQASDLQSDLKTINFKNVLLR